MKKSLQSLILLLGLLLPLSASADYVQLADGVYQDGSTLYITSGVTALGPLQVNPSVVYSFAAVPPACVSNTFTGYGATLHVPTASMVNYFSAQYWYNFTSVQADAVEPQSLNISKTEAQVEIGEQFSLTASVTPSNSTPGIVYWSSTNTDVATVNAGKVTAMGVGECYIRAICVDKQALCHVTVTPERVTVTVSPAEACLLPNHLLTLTATCTPATTSDFVVTSSNTAVAIPRYINSTIQVVGIAEGTATITVSTADGWCNSGECQVTVYTEIGDVNCDGFVNIADVTDLIDYLLSGNGDSVSMTNADCDKDGSVNIADVTALIDYLLVGYWPWDAPVYETFTVNGVTFKMVEVDGGTFTMGATAEQGNNAYSDEYPTHQVTLSSYSIGETEVTQALWQAVMGSNPSAFQGNLQRPVECVSWNDCQTFINKLNDLTGKTFRLPTEAEWEYAARGGNRIMGYKYAGSNMLGDVAWYYDNSYAVGSSSPDYGTHTVGTKAPNELGLYDMSGNVWEWCQDWYSSYSSESQTNPTGPASGSSRVSRGGSWAGDAKYCRVSSRNYYSPSHTLSYLGMRLVLGPDISPELEEHEYVDLGLPSGTLWATCNVGANAPEDYGDYFAWGETEPKNVYSWETYKWCNGSSTSITKYCTSSEYGSVDNKTELDPEDDAAWMNWGPMWRTPSLEQQEELYDYCTLEWTQINGVNGRLFTGPNGNTLFLPAAGYRWDLHYNVDSNGDYWSRTLSSFNPRALGMGFSWGTWGWGYGYGRENGYTIRAVCATQN